MGGLGELSQMQQHRLGSEAHDGDGGDVGETAARVATVTMKCGLTKWMTPSRNMTSSMSSRPRTG